MVLRKDQHDKRERESPENTGKQGMSTGAKIGILIGLVIVLAIGWWAGYVFAALACLIALGLFLFTIGIIDYFKGFQGPIVAEMKIGNVELKLNALLLPFLLGIGIVAYAGFLIARITWTKLLSTSTIEQKVSQEIAKLVPPRYRELLLLAQDEEKKPPIPEDESKLLKVVSLYGSAEYRNCLDLLATIKTDNDNMLDEILYYSIMAQYRIFETAVRRYGAIPVESLQELELQFKRFLNERRESKRFDTIHYWLGHFYLQVRKDSEAALKIFDEITSSYVYSDWIQGSLYYAALLHYKKGTPQDKKIAINNLKTLMKIDNIVKIVEINREFNARGVAEKLLIEWGFDPKQGIKSTSYREAHMLRPDNSLTNIDSKPESQTITARE